MNTFIFRLWLGLSIHGGLNMGLKEIFKETLEMYPKNIDISDGELILRVGGEGFYSTNFVSIYDTVEIKAEIER